MAASEIAYDIQAREGWTDTTLLDVVLDYIDNQEAHDAFADYLAERSSAEPESTITVTCPVVDPDGNGIEGCGRTYSAVPDDEGMIDCPHSRCQAHDEGPNALAVELEAGERLGEAGRLVVRRARPDQRRGQPTSPCPTTPSTPHAARPANGEDDVAHGGYFAEQMRKTLPPEALFGPISVPALKEERWKHVTDGQSASSDGAATSVRSRMRSQMAASASEPSSWGNCGMCFDPAHPNSQPQPAKFHRTVFEVEVLSQEPVAEDLGLDGLHYEITEGGMSGEVTRSVTEVVNAARMAELLASQGSDPEFFGIGCTHENQRVGHDNQFHCVDCGAWLGR